MMRRCKVKYPVIYIFETKTESACMPRSFQQKVELAYFFFPYGKNSAQKTL
jgi:hypothetical protein